MNPGSGLEAGDRTEHAPAGDLDPATPDGHVPEHRGSTGATNSPAVADRHGTSWTHLFSGDLAPDLAAARPADAAPDLVTLGTILTRLREL